MRGSRGESRGSPAAFVLKSGRENPMFDIAAVAIALACFGFLFALLYVLERV